MNKEYEIRGNKLVTDSFNMEFHFDIGKVILHKENYIILLKVPNDADEIDNVYGINSRGEIIWKIENPSVQFPTEKTGNPEFDNRTISTYVELNMDSEENFFALNFFGMRCQFDYTNGKLLKKEFLRW